MERVIDFETTKPAKRGHMRKAVFIKHKRAITAETTIISNRVTLSKTTIANERATGTKTTTLKKRVTTWKITTYLERATYANTPNGG